MNQTAGQLFDHIDGERDIDELAAAVDVDVDVARLGVQELVDAGLVTFDDVDGDVVSRRGLLKKIGVGTAAAAALPIVETIVAPTRAAASSLPGETEPPTHFPTDIPTDPPTMPPIETPAPTMTTTPPTPAPTPMPTPSPTNPEVLMGDVNQDGVVDTGDVQPFNELLSEGEFQPEADINGDGVVNLLDVEPFNDL